MNTIVSESNGLTTIKLEGMLDSSAAPKFQETISQQLEKENLNIVVDLADLAYTCSQGIRTILTLMKTVSSRKGKLVFRNIQPTVMEVFDMSGISQAMVIEEDKRQ